MCVVSVDILAGSDRHRALVAIVGIPASGKTTLAKKVVDR